MSVGSDVHSIRSHVVEIIHALVSTGLPLGVEGVCFGGREGAHSKAHVGERIHLGSDDPGRGEGLPRVVVGGGWRE